MYIPKTVRADGDAEIDNQLNNFLFWRAGEESVFANGVDSYLILIVSPHSQVLINLASAQVLAIDCGLVKVNKSHGPYEGIYHKRDPVHTVCSSWRYKYLICLESPWH